MSPYTPPLATAQLWGRWIGLEGVSSQNSARKLFDKCEMERRQTGLFLQWWHWRPQGASPVSITPTGGQRDLSYTWWRGSLRNGMGLRQQAKEDWIQRRTDVPKVKRLQNKYAFSLRIEKTGWFPDSTKQAIKVDKKKKRKHVHAIKSGIYGSIQPLHRKQNWEFHWNTPYY